MVEMMPLRALITGAGSGIGLETALSFARRGYRVIGTVRSMDRAEGIQRAADAEGLTVHVVALELGDATAIDDVARRVLAEAPLDVLVNNAGVAVWGPLELADERSVELQFSVNVLAPLRLARALIPAMRARGRGAIINVSSGAGFVARSFDGLYAARKHALEALSEALHYELRSYGVRVAIVEPGRFDTPIRDKEQFVDGFNDGSPYWSAYPQLQEAETSFWGGSEGEDPRRAAEIVLEAATTDQPRLLWLAGADVAMIAKLRGRDQVDSYEDELKKLLSSMSGAAAPSTP